MRIPGLVFFFFFLVTYQVTAGQAEGMLSALMMSMMVIFTVCLHHFSHVSLGTKRKPSHTFSPERLWQPGLDVQLIPTS